MSAIPKGSWESMFNLSGLSSTEFAKEVLRMSAILANAAMEDNGANHMTATYNVGGRVVRSTFEVEK